MTFLDKWLNIIRNCNIDNTYKMAWAKAITEISLEIDYNDESEYIEIYLKQIAEKMLKYYFDQTIFFDLIQGSNPNKPPKIISLVKELINTYQEKVGSKQPVKFYKAEVDKIIKYNYDKTINKIVAVLKQDVSYRFLNLGGEKIENIYKYNKGDDKLVILKSNLQELNRNYLIVFDIINFRWTQILEEFNLSPKISKKVKVIDIEEVKRKPLNKFIKYIEYENKSRECFICGEEIIGEKPSIDHVIPWSYLYDDNLWNLVFTHKSCNSSKNNIIPSEETIKRLEDRNIRLMNILRTKGLDNKITFELENAIKGNLVRKFWISCQS
jgi:dsRNA-specific ribonuclease